MMSEVWRWPEEELNWEGIVMGQDSTGKPIKVGDKVRHRGEVRIISDIRAGMGSIGDGLLCFEGTDVTAGEVEVDLIEE